MSASAYKAAKYSTEPAKCYPAEPKPDCMVCSRFSHGKRSTKVVSIDASTFRVAGECPMWIRVVQ